MQLLLARRYFQVLPDFRVVLAHGAEYIHKTVALGPRPVCPQSSTAAK
jgi:hypothetical protein